MSVFFYTFIEPQGQTKSNNRLIQVTFRFTSDFDQKEELRRKNWHLLFCIATPKSLPDNRLILVALPMSASRCPKATEDGQLRVGQSSIRRCTPVSASPTHIWLLSACSGQKVPHHCYEAELLLALIVCRNCINWFNALISFQVAKEFCACLLMGRGVQKNWTCPLSRWT